MSDYCIIVDAISGALVDAMQYRMTHGGDYRPLFVYVSHLDGGYCIDHDGQHLGMWRMPVPVTASMSYRDIPRHVERHCRSAPLFPRTSQGVA
jgi:hypothetical protein